MYGDNYMLKVQKMKNKNIENRKKNLAHHARTLGRTSHVTKFLN